MEIIEIPREWLEVLLRKGNQVNNAQEHREAWIANLLGYIQSAEILLKENV